MSVCPIGQPTAGLRGKRDARQMRFFLGNDCIMRLKKRDKARVKTLGFRLAFAGNELPCGVLRNLLPKTGRRDRLGHGVLLCTGDD